MANTMSNEYMNALIRGRSHKNDRLLARLLGRPAAPDQDQDDEQPTESGQTTETPRKDQP